jgi:hypothetical protein
MVEFLNVPIDKNDGGPGTPWKRIEVASTTSEE